MIDSKTRFFDAIEDITKRRHAASALATALVHMQAAFAGKRKPEYTDYQWKALKLASSALNQAAAAGIEQEG